MLAQAPDQDGTDHHLGREATNALMPAASVVVAVAAGVFLFGPRTSPFMVPLIALAVTAALDQEGPVAGSALAMGRRVWARLLVLSRATSPVVLASVIAALAFAGWALVSLAWAADPLEAVADVAQLVLFAVASLIVAVARGGLSGARLTDFARGLVIAFVVGLAYLCIEEATGHAIKRLVFTVLPFARLSTKHIGVEAESGAVLQIADYVSNRNMAALTLTLWPVLLLGWTVLAAANFARAARWAAMVILLAVAGITMAMSQHDTSVLALLASLAVVAITWRSPRAGLAVVTVGWLLATLAVVPVTDWAFRSAQMHHASWLPHTARQRIILWGYTAQQVPLRPWLGVGADSTRPLDARRGASVETPAGFEYQWRSGPHGHNVFLQTWYELGAPGAMLLCLLGLAVLRGIAGLTGEARLAMTAAFVSATITAAFTWGLWQTWFLGAFALSAMLAMLAVEADRRRRGDAQAAPDRRRLAD